MLLKFRYVWLPMMLTICLVAPGSSRLGRPPKLPPLPPPSRATMHNKVGAQATTPPLPQCVGQANGVFMPNPRGCQYFFYCHNGQALEANCPGQLWFDLRAGTCATQASVECTLNQPPPPAPQPTDPDDEDVVVDPQPVPPPTQRPPVVTESESVQCPASDSAEITFLASRVDCGRYFICYRGLPRRQQCIADLHWNAAVNRCDWPRNAKCPKKRDVPTCPRRGQAFYPHPEKCDYFIYCQNGHLSLQQCPFYHHWDLDTNTCRWRTMARCAIVE